MDAQAFRSPLAKFALALWMGCLHWPFTIPFVCALPLLPRSSKGQTQAWNMLIYCPGWSRDLGMQLSFVAVSAILLGIELLKVSNIRHPIALYLAVPVAAQLGTGFIAWPTFGVFPKFFSSSTSWPRP